MPLFRDLTEDSDDDSIQPDIFLDVPYVPSDETVVAAMLNLAGVGPKDMLYDLGSGDGRIVITAARKYGARGIGVELDPLRVADAMDDASDVGLECQVDFIEEDLFTVDFSEATVVTLYLMDSINVQLRPRFLKELRPGTRIISHAFDMGDWQADERIRLEASSIYKWIVPAQVAGTWEWEGLDGQIYRIDLQQKYQDVSGRIWVADKEVSLQSAVLSGACLDIKVQTESGVSPKYITLNFDHNDLLTIQESA